MTPTALMASLRGRASARRVRPLILATGLAVGLALVIMVTAAEMSSKPNFCGSCHVMRPYWESWKTSSHKNVACVDCHIAPGVGAEIRKKYEAMSMVVSYFTGTYGTNPWTEIDDSACLRCHERRLLSGKELFGDVFFDHAAHLAGMRGGKSLRCTSCHSQIVQGSHIAVTPSTCILCHFKGQTSGEGVARCTLCHTITDRDIRTGEVVFNHRDVGHFGMDCTSCHARPEGSEGAVPRERCLICHNEASRLAQLSDPELLHHKHVSAHKVDCLHCHLDIQHVAPARIETAAAACGSCHERGHSPQTDLYRGRGGRGVEAMPSPMFLAGVRCEGCHIDVPGETSGVRRASAVACMSCHGPGYLKIYEGWKSGMANRRGALARQVEGTERALSRRGDRALADARFNLDLVTKGRGVHNVAYAQALLERAHEDMNAARGSNGLLPLPLPWIRAAGGEECLGCHQGIESQSGSIFGRRFRHHAHLRASSVQGCATCHRPHEDRPAKEIVRFGPGDCEGCHHRGFAAGGEGAPDCLACHKAIRAKPTEYGGRSFDHAFHIDDAGQSCENCHELKPNGSVRLNTEICSACHG